MYNLAALHTQKGYVKITVECVKTGSFQTALDSEAIDRAVESLLSAVDLFQTILSYVSYLYLDAAVLPWRVSRRRVSATRCSGSTSRR